MQEAAQLKSQTHLGKTFEVMGAMMHGSMHENITYLTHTEISYLHHDDVIIWRGGNDPQQK
jgi:hypothetical protein